MISKILALFLALFVLSQAFEVPPALKRQVKKLHVRCANQTGLSDDILKQSYHNGVLPDDPAFKCFVHCMLQTFGLIDTDNIMHLESLIEVLPEELHGKINNLAESCGTQKGPDGCETAYLTFKCYIETDEDFMKGAIEELLL